MGMETFSLTGAIIYNELYINFDGMWLCPDDFVSKDCGVVYWKNFVTITFENAPP